MLSKYLIKGGPHFTPPPTEKVKETKETKETKINYKEGTSEDPLETFSTHKAKITIEEPVDIPVQAEFGQTYNPHLVTGRPTFQLVRSKQMTLPDFYKITNKNLEKERFETVIDEGKYNPPLAITFQPAKNHEEKIQRVVTNRRSERHLLALMKQKPSPIAISPAKQTSSKRRSTRKK